MIQRAKCKEQSAKSTKLLAKNMQQRAKELHALCSMLYALCFMLFVFSGCATTIKNQENLKTSEPTVVTGIDIQDNKVNITANKPFIYTIYKPEDPYKVVIDLPDVSIGDFNTRIVSNKAGITEVVPVQIESPSHMARLEVLLQAPSAVRQEHRNNVLTVTIEQLETRREKRPVAQEAKEEEAVPALPLEVQKPAESPMPEATEITDISFASSGNSVKVAIKGNGSMIPDVFPLDGRIVIDIPGVVLNVPLPSKVVAPVKAIRAGKHDDKVRLVLDLAQKANFEVDAQKDSVIVTVQRIGIEPALVAGEVLDEEKEIVAEPDVTEESKPSFNDKCQSYVEGREKINFDFQDQDIVPIFRLFADVSGCNLFVHPDVKGRATMKFRDVPWNLALDTILKTFSLGKSVDGNIIRIAPHAVFAKESEEKAKAEEAGIKAEPLETRIYPVSYADVSTVEAAVKNAKILSPRGSINVDKRTSTMLVKDIAPVFPEVENLLSTLDRPTPQVLVEARIVEVNTNSTRDLGIQWGINIKTTDTLASIGGLSGVPGVSTGPFTGGNYLVDFPATNVGPLSGSGITFGILNPARTIGLDLQLSAFETTGKGKIISNPRILTVDNGKAKILQGQSIPVRKLTTEGTISTEFKDVTLELNVTPHITPDKSVGMSIEIKKEDLDFTVPSVEGVPGTSKKEANTNVIIKNGETVVIGGIYSRTEDDTDKGVPGLMKVPILGWLFKNNLKTSKTNELLIFITPRIVEKP
ncbi:MAG: type IV pilus secretin PilQ [Nitrospirota bacterium]